MPKKRSPGIEKVETIFFLSAKNLFVLSFLFLSLGFLICLMALDIWTFVDKKPYLPKQTNYTKPISIEQMSQRCSNMTLENFSECLTKNAGTFYLYNLTDDNINLTFAEIQTRGGDCNDWSKLYSVVINSTSYKSYIALVNVRETNETITNHVFNIIADEKGYCIIDQLYWDCTQYAT